MKKRFNFSLNKRLLTISLAGFVPMLCLVVYLLVSLSRATGAYEEITKSIAYANRYSKDFKIRMDYSMYLAVIGNKSMEELGEGGTTVNGVVTVNPYLYIEELEDACDQMADMATEEMNRSRVKRIKNSLRSLKNCVASLEEQINGYTPYDEKRDYFEENIRGLTRLIQSGIQDYIYLETTHFTSVRAELRAKNRQISGLAILIAAAASGLSLCFSVLASRSVTRPIRELCDLTNKVAEGDFSVKTEVNSVDEIAVLTRSFNDMTEEIGMLVENIKKQQEDLRITETRLLQEQINPHFLYNTLDAIVWLAEEKKTDNVVKMVTSLSDFFRTTLSQGRDYITVQEEKNHIESYLEIQKFRYRDIMDYDIQIEEDIYDYIIPKLTLQPLVENALYHGIKNKRGKGRILIRGEKTGNKIFLKVIDNGKGMKEEELNTIRKKMAGIGGTSSKGFGVSNVNQRIKYYYGEEYGVFFESQEGIGTQATVIIEAKNIQFKNN